MCMSRIEPLAPGKKIDNSKESMSKPLFVIVCSLQGLLQGSPFLCRAVAYVFGIEGCLGRIFQLFFDVGAILTFF